MIDDRYNTGAYLESNPTWHLEDSPWKAEQVVKMLERNRLQPTTIGDVGCGAGEVINQLSLRLPPHVHFTGYEVSPQAFALCNQRQSERLEFRLADLTKEADARFDLLLALDVIEHVDDYFGFLRALRGKAEHTMFHIPLDFSVLHALVPSLLMDMRERYGHIHYFMADTALAALRETGYEVVDSFYPTGASFSTAHGLRAIPTRLARSARNMTAGWNQGVASRLFSGMSLLVLAKSH